MSKIMRTTRMVGLVLGGVVAMISMMAVAGLVTDNFLVRVLVAAIVVIGMPAFLSDRLLKKVPGGLSLVGDVFAIIMLAIAIAVVGSEFGTRRMLTDEGDRYARSGSTAMARVVYFLAGVSPVFPTDKGSAPTGSTPGPSSTSLDAGKK